MEGGSNLSKSTSNKSISLLIQNKCYMWNGIINQIKIFKISKCAKEKVKCTKL